MATVTLSDYLPLIAAVKKAPQRYLWSSYDAEAMCFMAASRNRA
jgi:hypothetical protein